MQICRLKMAGAVIGTVASAAALVTASSAQVARTLNVIVRDNAGTPVANVRVCAGSAADRDAITSAVTNVRGEAVLSVPADGAATVITASTADRGTSGTPMGPLTLLTLQLPANGGPQCPQPDPDAINLPGGQTLSRSAIAASQARAAAGRPGLVSLRRSERCFGAAGQQCSDRWMQLGTCVGGICTINVGSWRHDECCYAHPGGGMCDGKLEEIVTAQSLPNSAGQVCQAEFNTAFLRMGTIYSWQRSIDVNVVNDTGIVDHASYCAERGRFMLEGEDSYCCSRSTRAPNGVEMVAVRAGYAANPLTPRGTPRVCN